MNDDLSKDGNNAQARIIKVPSTGTYRPFLEIGAMSELRQRLLEENIQLIQAL